MLKVTEGARLGGGDGVGRGVAGSDGGGHDCVKVVVLHFTGRDAAHHTREESQALAVGAVGGGGAGQCVTATNGRYVAPQSRKLGDLRRRALSRVDIGDQSGKYERKAQEETELGHHANWRLTRLLKDHFYVYSIGDSDSGVSIDIFNVDSGDASTHGAQQTCCQCYGYAEGDDKKCKNAARGDKVCCGGDTEMFDACFNKFTEWSDDSRTQLAKEVAASTATWKIVNSHYSPYAHCDEAGMKKWFDILKDSGVQLWMNGHTHGENHDYSSSHKVHFVDNGAGGGIQKESASGIPEFAAGDVENLWVYGGHEYGFMSVEASEEWLKLQYHTADDSWSYAESFNSTTIGGVATKHCWYIPVDGGTGKEC